MRTAVHPRTQALAAALALAGSSALADPAVRPGGKPGAVAEWKTAGDVVTLVVDADYAAEDVADGIREAIEGAQAKVDGAHVVVTGVAEPALLAALEKIDVPPAMDDVDAMLGALQNPGGDEDGSGSSIRARKSADFTEVLGPPGHLVYGKVVEVRRARFPLVLVTVQVGKGPKRDGPSRGDLVTVLPRVKSRDGVVDPDDAASQLNVGAWYAKKGDRVRLRLEDAKKGIWVAKAFERIE